MSKLSPYESETIVNYNKGEAVAYIYSANQTDINKFKRLGYKCVSKDEHSATFETDKKNISYRSNKPSKRPKKVLSDEHKAKLKEAREKVCPRS